MGEGEEGDAAAPSLWHLIGSEHTSIRKSPPTQESWGEKRFIYRNQHIGSVCTRSKPFNI